MTNPSGEFLLIRTECLICGRNVCHILHRKGDLPDRHGGHLVQVSNPTNRFRDRLSKRIKETPSPRSTQNEKWSKQPEKQRSYNLLFTGAKMMMQLLETPKQKNSLFNAMNRFMGAVNDMDQTILVPSLLRDVPLEEDREMGGLKSDVDEGDMYSYYELLKSIRSDMEWGVRCASADERHKESMKITRSHSSASTCSSASSSISSSFASFSEEEDEGEDEDLQKQFQFHLTGLHGVLSKLTQQANSLTKRYKQELGIGGWGQ